MADRNFPKSIFIMNSGWLSCFRSEIETESGGIMENHLADLAKCRRTSRQEHEIINQDQLVHSPSLKRQFLPRKLRHSRISIEMALLKTSSPTTVSLCSGISTWTDHWLVKCLWKFRLTSRMSKCSTWLSFRTSASFQEKHESLIFSTHAIPPRRLISLSVLKVFSVSEARTRKIRLRHTTSLCSSSGRFFVFVFREYD